MPTPPVTNNAIVRAMNSCYSSKLYVESSSYVIARGGASIGRGLFTRVPLQPGDFIVRYIGEIVTNEEMDRRIAEGKGGYSHILPKRPNEQMDCYPFLDICKASMANDYRGLKHKNTGVKARKNARAYYTRAGFPALRVLTRDEGGNVIPAGAEILTHYGGDYQFPNLT